MSDYTVLYQPASNPFRTPGISPTFKFPMKTSTGPTATWEKHDGKSARSGVKTKAEFFYQKEGEKGQAEGEAKEKAGQEERRDLN